MVNRPDMSTPRSCTKQDREYCEPHHEPTGYAMVYSFQGFVHHLLHGRVSLPMRLLPGGRWVAFNILNMVVVSRNDQTRKCKVK